MNKNIVLIADRVKDHSNAKLETTTLEFIEDDYFYALYSSLSNINPNLKFYETPKDFLDNIHTHKNDIVLSVWSGEKSRNRKALVPSICEAYRIPYVGADPYVQIISADKHLSKKICEKFDIPGANDVLIFDYNDFWMLKTIKFPAIIKPNFEGGSIGIFEKSVVNSIYEAEDICKSLLRFYSPLIVEEYLKGEEVSVCIAGVSNHIDVFEIMLQKLGNKTYFTHEIFSAEVKKVHNSSRIIESANNALPEKEKKKLIDLYNYLGKTEVMRIDGRIRNNRFQLIELTPDCSLNISGSMSLAFKHAGYTYTKMLEKLLDNTIKSWEDQNSNK